MCRMEGEFCTQLLGKTGRVVIIPTITDDKMYCDARDRTSFLFIPNCINCFQV
jgi:hypothetical protein